MGINATLFGQMITFGLFVWFTMKFVWPPITKAMAERQTRISEGLAAAEKGETELAQAQVRVDAVLRDAREQAQQIIAQANKRSSEMVDEAKTSAQAEGDRQLAQAQAQIEQERAQAREALRKQVSELALAGASKILDKELDAKKHSALIDDLAAQL